MSNCIDCHEPLPAGGRKRCEVCTLEYHRKVSLAYYYRNRPEILRRKCKVARDPVKMLRQEAS